MSTSLPRQKNLISISQAAKFLEVSIDTVRRWDSSGILHSERLDGKNRYFSLNELRQHKSGQPLSISEAAKELAISPTTLRRLETRGILVPGRNNAGERVYDKASISNFLKSDYFLRKKPVYSKNIGSSLHKKTISEDYTIQTRAQNHKKGSIKDHNQDLPLSLLVGSSKKLFLNSLRSYRIPEIFASMVIFLLLIAIGTTNIALSKTNSSQPASSPAVLSETIEHKQPDASITTETETPQAKPTSKPTVEPKAEPTAEPTAEPVTLESIQSLIDGATDFNSDEATASAGKEEASASSRIDNFRIMLSVEGEGAEYINIREKPSLESAPIGRAVTGDTFEMVSRDSDWYEIKLNEESNGFIMAKFAQIKEIK